MHIYACIKFATRAQLLYKEYFVVGYMHIYIHRKIHTYIYIYIYIYTHMYI